MKSKAKKILFSLGSLILIAVPSMIVSCSSNISIGKKATDSDLAGNPEHDVYDGNDTNQTKNYKVTIVNRWNGQQTHPQVPGYKPYFTSILWALSSITDSAYWIPGKSASGPFATQTQTGNTTPLINDVLKKNNIKYGVNNGNLHFDYVYSFNISVSQNSPFLTMSSQFHPSPDWFWGISRFALYKNGWLKQSNKNIILFSSATRDSRYDDAGKIIAPVELNNDSSNGVNGKTKNIPFGYIKISAL